MRANAEQAGWGLGSALFSDLGVSFCGAFGNPCRRLLRKTSFLWT